MENSKKYKIYKIGIVVIIVIILGFVYKSFFISDQEKITDNGKIVNNNDKDDNKLFNDGQFEQTIKDYEKKGTGSLEREEKMKLVYSYLNFGNYFYKEEENSKKAMDILSTMDENWEVLYYKGYANEIIKDYTGSLDYYFKGLEIKELTPENKSLLLNQVGHLYDLKGEGDKVLYYYEEAYKLNDKNDSVLSNLGRYYAINGDYEKAYEFLNKALALTNNLPMKGELNFSLSSIELEKNGLNPDIDKSIEYAKQSIKAYPSYPMGYIALARGLYMKNDPKNNKEIESNLDKSIELNPEGYYAYEIYALHEFDKGDKEKTKSMLIKSVEAAENDMILMDSEREKVKQGLFFDAMIIGFLNANSSNHDMITNFIDNNKGTTSSRIAIQIKRNNYGVFSFLKDDDKFKLIIKNFK